MKAHKSLILLAGLAGGLFASATVFALEAPVAGGAQTDKSPFQIISDRNIFNPDRRSVLPVVPPPPRVEYFALRGTLAYADENIAFFESADRSHNQALRPLDTVAASKIIGITGKSVKLLTAGGRVIELQVGMRMQRIEDGQWEPAAGTGSSGEMNLPGSKFTTPAGGTDEAVKQRLTQRRAQQ